MQLEAFECRVDIGFLIDISGSIGSGSNWNFLMNFVIVLAQSMNISATGAHAAVTTFDHYVYHPIKFSDDQDLPSFVGAVDSIINNGGATHTIEGFDGALNEMFQERNGMRIDVQKVLFFLTDGSCIYKQCTDDNFIRKKNQLDIEGIKVIGIGVMKTYDQKMVDEMKLVVDPDNYFNVSDFIQLYDQGLPRKLGLCDGMLIISFHDTI